MAQSQNKSIEFQTTGVSYLGLGGKVGKFLAGDVALEFYANANVEDYIQLPWSSIQSCNLCSAFNFRKIKYFY